MFTSKTDMDTAVEIQGAVESSIPSEPLIPERNVENDSDKTDAEKESSAKPLIHKEERNGYESWGWGVPFEM